jgi:hypothetical protein
MADTDAYVDDVVDAFRAQFEADLTAVPAHAGDPAQLGRDAAAFVAARHLRTDAVTERIGPVYGTQALAEYLAPAGSPFDPETVRKRATKRQLVAFRTGDGQWAFPEWQFDAVGGVLTPNVDVVALWRLLPHGRWLADADLVMWLNTTLRSLDATPAERSRVAGADDPDLRRAVSRLRARIDGHAA